MTLKCSVLALSIALSLAACGSDDSSSNSNNEGNNGGNSGTPEEVLPTPSFNITPWTKGSVTSAVAAVSLTQGDDADVCFAGTNNTVETENFIVSYGRNNVTKDPQSLASAARLTQVALDELIAQTGLSKADDLGLDAQNKWVACYNTSADQFSGSAELDWFEFQPKSVDPDNEDFMDGYVLAKHEIFHIVQMELAGQNQAFHTIPRWFSESTAELFAGETYGMLTPNDLTQYLTDTATSPFSIETYYQEKDITNVHTDYEDRMYGYYLESLAYLNANGMTKAHVVQLLRDAGHQTPSQDYSPFYRAFSTLENSLTLPVTLTQLQQANVYQTHVVDDWITATVKEDEFVGKPGLSFVSLYIESVDGQISNDGATVAADQSAYFLRGNFKDGQYYVYASTDDMSYGPLTVTVKNGQFGKLDFTNAPVFSPE